MARRKHKEQRKEEQVAEDEEMESRYSEEDEGYKLLSGATEEKEIRDDKGNAIWEWAFPPEKQGRKLNPDAEEFVPASVGEMLTDCSVGISSAMAE